MTKDLPPEVLSQLDDLLSKLGCKETLTKEFLNLSLQNVILFDKKNADYGPKNISGFGVFGCVVRMSDKMERLKTLLTTKRSRARNEPFVDSLDDISNYAIIAKLCHKGTWPK